MRFRRSAAPDDAEVAMSPLIDCVFLLLIFFLVTSMIKRSERQIPITLADPTSAVAQSGRDDTMLIGVDVDGVHYERVGRDFYGRVTFKAIGEAGLPEFLRGLAAERGTDIPIELIVERQTPFQAVIQTLDLFELQGFDNVRSRVRPNALEGGS